MISPEEALSNYDNHNSRGRVDSEDFTLIDELVASTKESSGNGDKDKADEEEDADAACERGAKKREYIKEMLSAHSIWHNSNSKFWEQALWQCAIEQVRLSATKTNLIDDSNFILVLCS